MRRLATSLVVISLLSSCQSETTADATTTLVPTTGSTTDATSTSVPIATTVPPLEDETAIYLFFEGYPVAPGPYLAAVSRTEADDLTVALTALLEGVTDDETAMGLSSTIPSGTELLGVEVSEGVASVDLSREFESGGGSLSMMGRVAQVVYTATGFDDVDSVRFSLEGVSLDVLGGEGLVIDEPQTRSDWIDLIPPIFLEKPSWGSTVGNEMVIAGTAELESGTMAYVIVDADGLIIHEDEIATTAGERSVFSVPVVVEEIPNPGMGSIIAWEWASDGSQQHVVEYPLNLVDMP